MTTMTIEFPDDVYEALRRSPTEVQKEVLDGDDPVGSFGMFPGTL